LVRPVDQHVEALFTLRLHAALLLVAAKRRGEVEIMTPKVSNVRLSIVLVAALSACSVNEPGAGWIATDSTSYTAQLVPGTTGQYAFRVITRFANRGLVDVYLGRCSPASSSPMYGVTRWASSGEAAYDPAWGCVGHDKQFLVRPGGVRVDTLDIRGPNVCQNGASGCEGALEGAFRIAFVVVSAPGEDAPADFGKGSNPFKVKLH
jgi:hypothetical protein